MGKIFVRRGLAALLTLALVLSLTPAVFAADPTVRVSLSQTQLSIPLGMSKELTASASGNDGNGATVTNPTITWSSDNLAIATVAGGKVTGVSKGKTNVKATCTVDGKNFESVCEVTVGDPIVTGLEVKLLENSSELPHVDNDPGKAYEKIMTDGDGDSVWLSLDVKAIWSDPLGGELRDNRLTWTAKCRGDAVSLPQTSGSGNGSSIQIKRGKSGNATVTIEVKYNNLSDGGQVTETVTCQVKTGTKTEVVITEYNTPDASVTGRPLTATVNQAKQLYAFVVRDDGVLKDAQVTWSSSDPSVATIAPASGLLNPIKEGGRTEITATYTYTDENGQSATAVGKVTCIITKNPSTDPTDPDDPVTPPTGDTLPDGVSAVVTITSPKSTSSEPYTMDPGTTNVDIEVKFIKAGMTAANTPAAPLQGSQSGGVVARYVDADTGTGYEVPVIWTSSNRDAAQVTASGNRFRITADQPGNATLTATVDKATASVDVEVNGFVLLKDAVEIEENGSMELDKDGIIGVYGTAKTDELACWSDASNIAAYAGGKIAAYVPGETTFTVSDTKRGFRASFDVTVTADPNATIDYGTLYVKTQKVLNFSDLLSRFRRQAGGRLSHITGLNMDSSKGTLYYKYKESSGSGTGVGAGSYYHPYRSGGIPTGGQSLEDLTFVPKSGYAGPVTIYYTAVSEEGQNYTCKLELIVDPGSGSDAGIALDTPYNTPLRFTGDDFNRVCRERLGVKLDYVTFSQPPERQGTLYTNYSGSGNYGSAVDMHRKYSLKELDDIWFVPAPGYSGTVTVYYTAFGVGTNAGSYAGQVDIVVGRENGVAIGGLTYDIAKGGVAHFDDADFEQYCRELTDRGQELSFIRFNALPAGSEGVLYYDYRSSSSTGSRAATGTNYYYGSRSPRIDWLAFVPAEDFVGTVRIPFTGWTTDGGSFSGNVEVNVRSGVATQVGDILYICPAGKTVSFDDTDFNRLSRNVTGSSLNYITFRSLPASSAGTLYYNSSRAVTGTRYRNGTSTPRIDNLSFRASSSFSGIVDIPFEAQATNGDTFRGVVTVSSSRINSSTGSGDYWGSGGASTTVFTDMAGYSDSQKAAVDYIYSRGITHGLTATLYGPQNSIRRGDFALMIYQAFGLTSSSAAQPFADVPAGAYYSQAVNALYSRGVVSGVGGGYYAPDSTLTRQDAVCMVQRAMRATGRSAEDGSSSALYSYSDGGSVSSYAQGAMAMAVQRDYLPTYGGWLNPTQALTRVDMAEILYRVLTY